MKIDFVIPCLLGMESLISSELREMGAENVNAENGRVLFSGDANMLARVNICSRFAERVQILVGSFEARSFEELFQGTKALPWEEWIGSLDAFPVKGYSINSGLFSTRDCQSIIKKAVVERLRSKYHIEWFEETGPVHQIQFSIMKDKVSLLIDTSGYGLHKRGYRLDANGAPIKETLAAALCSLSCLRPYHKLYDPMCGSGTILIEGAMMAANIAPGINRRFSAERFGVIDRAVWEQERERARSLERPCDDFEAFGSDIDPKAIEIAKINAKRAGVDGKINFNVADVSDAVAVHQHVARRNRFGKTRSLAVYLKHAAYLGNENVAAVDAERQCQLAVSRHMAVLTVHRHEIARLDQRLHQLKLLLAGVSRNVHLH